MNSLTIFTDVNFWLTSRAVGFEVGEVGVEAWNHLLDNGLVIMKKGSQEI